jgi:succinate-acetate transporter protein
MPSPYPVFAWFIFTFLMLVCTFRATLAFVILFFTLDMAFLFLALEKLLGSTSCQKAGGVFGGCRVQLAASCQR